MPEPSYHDDLLIMVSQCYYIDNLPQAQIAKLANVSQSKVSRLLSLARERGLVRVSVPEYEPRSTSLEQQFRDTLKVNAIIIRTAPGLQAGDLRHSLGYFAAPAASAWIKAPSIAAVGGGRAMQALIQHMRPQTPAPGVRIVQAMGNIDSCPGPYDAVELGRSLASRWDGTFLTLNVPAILPDENTCRRFLDLEQIRFVTEQFTKATIAFVGVGSLDNSVFVARKVLKPEQIQLLRAAGAVGEMLGRFYDIDGNECATELQRRVVSLRLTELRAIPQVVAVVAGADRSDAVLAGIRGGLINALIIDEGGAAAVLEKASANAS